MRFEAIPRTASITVLAFQAPAVSFRRWLLFRRCSMAIIVQLEAFVAPCQGLRVGVGLCLFFFAGSTNEAGYKSVVEPLCFDCFFTSG